MARILLTAFEPYDRWKTNASWLCLVELTRNLPVEPNVTTRLYPVDFAEVRSRLEQDVKSGYDYILHLGQAPGVAAIHLEAVGLNVGRAPSQAPSPAFALAEEGPAAYFSQAPLDHWVRCLEESGVPVRVSYHAGTYLCNAALYWTHHFCAQLGLSTRAAFIHLPLETTQAIGERSDAPSLPATLTAQALRVILTQLSPVTA